MAASIIAAVADNGVIGLAGGLPWRLPADLAHFKRLTMGHHLVIGRRTWDELAAPLPGRTLVVVTRDRRFAAPGVLVADSLEAALERVGEDPEPFIAGGAQVYRLALDGGFADTMYLTRVHAEPAGDTWFPDFDRRQWRLSESRPRPADDRNPYAMTFELWRRQPAAP